ncbi:MAG: right-handed parallel beta-helix repeat-containing protein [Clostridia bacterium]|nr:right-handed parallel beta-helix repeat-containing protein [Clostridia bacterium]
MTKRTRISTWLSCVCAAALLAVLTLSFGGSAVNIPKLSADFTADATAVTAYGAAGNGSTNDYNAVLSAVSAKSTLENGGTVYFPNGVYRLSSSMTVPANVELLFADGASLLLDSGVTLTLNGSVNAGDHAVFTGSGTVAGTPNMTGGNPMWFGAVADGVTDCSAAFQKTVNLFSQVDVPYTENGFGLTRVDLNKAVVVKGRDAQRAKIVGLAGATGVFVISAVNVTVSDLSFNMNATGTDACCFYFDDVAASTYGISHVYLMDMDAVGAYCFVRDALVNTFKISVTHFERITCTQGRGTAFRTKAMYGFIFLTDVTLDYSASPAVMTYPAISISNNEGMILNRVNITGKAGSTSAAHGIDVQDSVAMWFENCTITGMTGNGINLRRPDHLEHIYIYNNTVSYCANGVSVANGTDVQLHRNTFSCNTANGMSLSGRRIQASKNICNANAARGIYSTATYSVFTENTCIGNGSNGLYSGGNYCSAANHGSADNALADVLTGTGSGFVQLPPIGTIPDEDPTPSGPPAPQGNYYCFTNAYDMAVGSNITVSAYGNAFALSATAASNIVIPIVDTSLWTSKPYLVIDADSSSTGVMTMRMAWNNASWFDGDAPFSSASVDTYQGRTVIDLSPYINAHGADSIWIYIYDTPGAAGGSIRFANFYLTDVNPLA